MNSTSSSSCPPLSCPPVQQYEGPSHLKPINTFLPYRVRPELRDKIEMESTMLIERRHKKNLASRGNIQGEIRKRIDKMEVHRIRREEQWREKTKESPLLRDYYELDIAREKRTEDYQAMKGKLISQRRLLNSMTGVPEDPTLLQSKLKDKAGLAEQLALQMRELNRRKREVERETEAILKLQRAELGLLERQFKGKDTV